MGSTRYIDMHHVVHKIWHLGISENNLLSATHIPGALNVEEDKESRQQELRTEWMLNRQDFKFVAEKLGFVTTIDLFASRINTQLEKFMLYRPHRKCIAIDLVTQ